MSRSKHNYRIMFLFFLIEFLVPPPDPDNNNNINEASTVVDIDSSTQASVDSAEEASGSEYTVSTVLDSQITTSHGALNPTEGVSSRITHFSSSVTSDILAAVQPASTNPSRTWVIAQDQTNLPPHGYHHQGESSSSSTSNLPKNPRCLATTDDKKKGVVLCDADNNNNINGGASTQQHPATDDNPSVNLDLFLKFLREQELSKNLTQVAIAVATCLYGGTTEAIHPKMRSAVVLLLSVGLQCFWCGTLSRNARTELLGQVLIVAAFHMLLVNLLLPSPWALIPAATYIAFLVILGMHFRKELQ